MDLPLELVDKYYNMMDELNIEKVNSLMLCIQ